MANRVNATKRRLSLLALVNKKYRNLNRILEEHPKFSNYLDEEKRIAFMNQDEGFISDLEVWKENAIARLEQAKGDLNEILNSDLMKQAARFAPWVRERWEGQLAVILELLGQVEGV